MKRLAAVIISIVFIFNACSRHAAENKIFNTAETEGKAAKLAETADNSINNMQELSEWEEPPELELERERGESLLARMMAGMIVVTFIGVLIYYGSRTEPSGENPIYRQYQFVYQRDPYDDLADQELRDQLREPQDAPLPPPVNPPVRTGLRRQQHAPPPPPVNPPVRTGLREQLYQLMADTGITLPPLESAAAIGERMLMTDTEITPPPPPANPPVRTGLRRQQHAPPPPPANPPVQTGLRAQAEILQRNAQPPNER